MQIFDTLMQVINFNTIWALPWIVKGPGLFLMLFFISRSIARILTLNLISGVTNLVYTIIIAIILSRFGRDIAQLIEGAPPIAQ